MVEKKKCNTCYQWFDDTEENFERRSWGLIKSCRSCAEKTRLRDKKRRAKKKKLEESLNLTVDNKITLAHVRDGCPAELGKVYKLKLTSSGTIYVQDQTKEFTGVCIYVDDGQFVLESPNGVRMGFMKVDYVLFDYSLEEIGGE